MKHIFIKLFLSLLLCAPLYSFSKEVRAEEWHKQVELGLEFPLYFGVHGKWNFYKDVYVRAGGGFASQLLVQVIEGLSFINPSLNPSELDLAKQTISDALYLSASIGMKLDQHLKGLYLDVGYSYMYPDKDLDSEFLNKYISKDKIDEKKYPSVPMNGHIHNLVGHLGYTLVFDPNLSVSGELGFVKPIYSTVNYKNSKKELTASSRKELIDKSKKVHKKLWMPTISAWLTYNF